MRVLIVFLLFFSTVNANLDKIPTVDSTELRLPEKHVVPQNGDLNCQKITALYTGTFEYPSNRSYKFAGELQINIEISLQDQKIYLKVDNYTKAYARGYWFRVWNETGNVLRIKNYSPRKFNVKKYCQLEFSWCNTNQKQTCSISFTYLSRFSIYFWPFDYKWEPDLIWIDPIFNNKFTLLNPIGKCSKTIKNNYPRETDPFLYYSCFCCGDAYNPDASLKCPESPWK